LHRPQNKIQAKAKLCVFGPWELYLPQPVQEAYNGWRKDPPSFLRPIAGHSIGQPVFNLATFYYEAERICGEAALYQLYDSVYCLFFYWLVGSYARCRDQTKVTDYIATRFLNEGVQRSPECIKKFVIEQWKLGEKLEKFCLDCVGDLGAVFFLPGSVVG